MRAFLNLDALMLLLRRLNRAETARLADTEEFTTAVNVEVEACGTIEVSQPFRREARAGGVVPEPGACQYRGLAQHTTAQLDHEADAVKAQLQGRIGTDVQLGDDATWQ